MTNWNASNYKQRKAERLALVKPEWIINPETQEQFYLRKVGGLMSSVLAGYMPAGLTSVAVEAWKEKGVEGLDVDSVASFAATLTPEQREAGERETAEVSRIVQRMCVIPLLSNQLPDKVVFDDEWKAQAIAGLKEKDPHFDVDNKFDPRDLVLNPKELDDKDTMFLFSWARGLGNGVAVKGGGSVTAGNFHPLSKKPARGSRTGASKSAILKAS